jgi:hypothetical protein
MAGCRMHSQIHDIMFRVSSEVSASFNIYHTYILDQSLLENLIDICRCIVFHILRNCSNGRFGTEGTCCVNELNLYLLMLISDSEVHAVCCDSCANGMSKQTVSSLLAVQYWYNIK